MQTKFNLLQVIDLLLRSRASITIANQKRYYCHGHFKSNEKQNARTHGHINICVLLVSDKVGYLD